MNKAIAWMGFLLAAGLTHAGTRQYLAVSVGTTYAYGSIGDARASADSLQFIGCFVQTSTSNSATCAARDAANDYLSCYTTDPNLIAAARSISSDSVIEFYTPSGSSTCRTINVNNSSQYAPRQP